MTIFYGGRDLLEITGAVTPPRRRRRPGLWSRFGPLLPIACAAGMLAGTALVVLGQ